MSKERGLLNLCAVAFKAIGICPLLLTEISELLDQPEQTEQEPVAWIIETEIYGKLSEWVCMDKKHYLEEHDSIKEPIPLYTAPPVKSEQEPVGIVRTIGGYPDDSEHVVDWLCKYKDLKEGDKLYLAPPKREPLINIYVLNAFKADDEATHPYSYWAGVDFAEKHHGIGG